MEKSVTCGYSIWNNWNNWNNWNIMPPKEYYL